jgi:hypothetical protein
MGSVVANGMVSLLVVVGSLVSGCVGGHPSVPSAPLPRAFVWVKQADRIFKAHHLPTAVAKSADHKGHLKAIVVVYAVGEDSNDFSLPGTFKVQSVVWSSIQLSTGRTVKGRYIRATCDISETSAASEISIAVGDMSVMLRRSSIVDGVCFYSNYAEIMELVNRAHNVDRPRHRFTVTHSDNISLILRRQYPKSLYEEHRVNSETLYIVVASGE